MSSHLNFMYTSIYGAADNREGFRRWSQASYEMRNQLPELYAPIIALERAQISIWDGDFDAAVAGIDEAKVILDQSVITVLMDNLIVTDLFVNVALLYLDAGATDKAKSQLEDVLLAYPSNAYAMFILGRTLVAEGDEENARLFLENAIELDGYRGLCVTAVLPGETDCADRVE